MTQEYSKTFITLAITMLLSFIVEVFSKTPSAFEDEVNEKLITRDTPTILKAK